MAKTVAPPRRRPVRAATAPLKSAALDPDIAQIVVGLARVNDPMFTYLIAMMIDRVSELVIAARKPVRG